MKISDLSDKIIVMNLDKRTDRLHNCNLQAEKFNFNFVRINSIDGSLINNNTNLRNGELGLLKTYKKVLEYCIDENFQQVLIMEDDFQFDEDVEERLEEIKLIPDNWDVIYLGANHYHLGAGTIKPIKINDKIIRIYSSYGAHSIIIKKSMYQKIYEKILEYKFPIDVIFANMQIEINAYGFIKNICKQYDSYSDILCFNPFYNAKGIFN